MRFSGFEVSRTTFVVSDESGSLMWHRRRLTSGLRQGCLRSAVGRTRPPSVIDDLFITPSHWDHVGRPQIVRSNPRCSFIQDNDQEELTRGTRCCREFGQSFRSVTVSRDTYASFSRMHDRRPHRIEIGVRARLFPCWGRLRRHGSPCYRI